MLPKWVYCENPSAIKKKRDLKIETEESGDEEIDVQVENLQKTNLN